MALEILITRAIVSSHSGLGEFIWQATTLQGQDDDDAHK